jgi:hypothetical protein
MADVLITKTLLFGVGGAIVGGLHAVLNLVTDTTETKTVLCTPYECIQSDSLLLKVLSEIDEEFKEIDHVAAIRTVHAIDKLVGIRMLLERKDQEPVMADRVAGIVCFRRAKQAIQRFISRAEIVKNPRRVIHLQRHSQTIMRQLDAHLQSIVMATRDMYMHP